MLFLYKTRPCPDKQGCLFSAHTDLCFDAHTDSEILRRRPYNGYRGFNYTTDKCSTGYNDPKKCSGGKGCSKCHSWQEFLYHPSKYKVTACTDPQWLNDGQCSRGPLCCGFHKGAGYNDRMDQKVDASCMQDAGLDNQMAPPQSFIQWAQRELQRRKGKSKQLQLRTFR